jgi:aminopeptidase
MAMVCVFLTTLFTASISAAERDYDSVADRVVNYSLKVQPGESVLVTGTPAELDLLEALVVAVYKAGGRPTVELNIPEANKRAVVEMPIEYLTYTPTYTLMQLRAVDCFINTGSIQQPGLFADVPEERFAAIRKSDLPVTRALKTARFRSVDLGQVGGMPTEAFAKARGADYGQMQAMFWNAIDTDYQSVVENGELIAEHLVPNAEVEVTSSAGTDLRLRVHSTPPGINSGRTGEKPPPTGPDSVWLPAGEVYVAADPSSASGTLVVPQTWFRNQKIENLRLSFENGKLTSVSADNNVSALKETLKTAENEANVLSLIDIGLNPDSQPLKGASYYSYEMAGVVTLGIGSNTWTGGNVVSDIAMQFHLPGATVKVGGKTVVDGGKLAVR